VGKKIDRLLLTLLDTPVVQVDFSQVHQQPLLHSRLGFAQNLLSLGGLLEGSVPYLLALGANHFCGAAEGDAYFKNGPIFLPFLNATYDVTGRAISMTTTPPSLVTDWPTMLRAIGCRAGIEIIGETPQTQRLYSSGARRHPDCVDIASSAATWAQFIKYGNWNVYVDWFIGNEWLRTMLDIDQGIGFNTDGSTYTFAETVDQYTLRRQTMKELAVTVEGAKFLGMYSTAGGLGVGKWSTANAGPHVNGDQRTFSDRSMLDGRSARKGWWDFYNANILTASQVALAAYVACNDFKNRANNMVAGDVNDFGGLDVLFYITQCAPSLLKVTTADDDGGGEGGPPSSDTRMGPACEMLTMMAADTWLSALSVRCWSYWVGGQDAFLTYVSPGVYTINHRYTAMQMWVSVPSRRVPVTKVCQVPLADGSLYGVQGLMGVAGIDPGGQTASILLWNEGKTSVTVKLQPMSLPGPLAGATPSHMVLDEDHALGTSGTWDGGPITLAPRTIHRITWSVGTSPHTRRDPLDDGVHLPVFQRRSDAYKRPKVAAANTCAVTGEAWVMPTSSNSTAMATGAAWSNAPDSVWLTLWVHNLDLGSAQVKATCDYGSGPVTLLNTTAGAIAAGQVTQLNLLASAPGGWAAGAREADIQVSLGGSCNQRLECWFSGTQTKANAVKGA
jgi:hypothetical protein